MTEQEFIQELKELEKEAVGMESRISEVKANKNQILDEIVEAERQVLLWEKKIQLSKETQVRASERRGRARGAKRRSSPTPFLT